MLLILFNGMKRQSMTETKWIMKLEVNLKCMNTISVQCIVAMNDT